MSRGKPATKECKRVVNGECRCPPVGADSHGFVPPVEGSVNDLPAELRNALTRH